MNVYEIESEIQTQSKKKHVKRWGKRDWSRGERIHVLTDGDATTAIEKARRHTLRQKPEEFEDGAWVMLQRTVDFRVTRVEYLCTIDVP